MKAFDFLLFPEPLLAVDVDLLRVREIYLGRHSPHTRLKMTHFSVLHLLLLPLTPHLLSFFTPTPTTSPWAIGAEMEGEMDDVVLNCDMSPCKSFHYYS